MSIVNVVYAYFTVVSCSGSREGGGESLVLTACN